MTKSGVEISETHITGPLPSRRIISLILEGDEDSNALRKHDAIRSELNKERRGKIGSDVKHMESAPSQLARVAGLQISSRPKQNNSITEPQATEVQMRRRTATESQDHSL